jgi:hypothetical protein
MGSHAKPRTTGRKAALGALALGASLTGVGLIAAALDPATAVLTASGPDDEGATQLSGLSSPVSVDLSPAADSIANLSAAPLPTAGALAATSRQSAADSAGSVVRHARSAGASGGSSGSRDAVKPIEGSNPTTGSGSGYTGKHKAAGSGTPPTETAAVTSAIQDAVSPVTSTVQSVVAPVTSTVESVVTPVTSVVETVVTPVTSVVRSAASPVTSTVSSVPVVGSLLGGTGLL